MSERSHHRLKTSQERRQIITCGCDENLEVDRPVTMHDAVAQATRVRPRDRRVIGLDSGSELADRLGQDVQQIDVTHRRCRSRGHGSEDSKLGCPYRMQTSARRAASTSKSSTTSGTTRDMDSLCRQVSGTRSTLSNRHRASGRRGTRTPDQCLVRAVLYQLSYAPANGRLSLLGRSAARGSDHGLPVVRRATPALRLPPVCAGRHDRARRDRDRAHQPPLHPPRDR